MALGFLFIIFLRCFDLHTNCDEFVKVYPPNVFMVQREGCPVTHASKHKTRLSVRCFDKVKFDPKTKESENDRDCEQSFVRRVSISNDPKPNLNPNPNPNNLTP